MIIKDKDKIIAALNHETFEPERKRMRTSIYNDVEGVLLMWFKNIHGRNVLVSYDQNLVTAIFPVVTMLQNSPWHLSKVNLW